MASEQRNRRGATRAWSLLAGTLLLLACSGGAVGGGTGSPDGGAPRDAGSSQDGSAPGTWFVSDTIRGTNLQVESSSAIAQRAVEGDTVGTAVTLSGLPNFCALLRKNPLCSEGGFAQQSLYVYVPKTDPGTYSIEANEAVVALSFFGDTCERTSPTIQATAGWVKLTEVNLTTGGKVAVTFDVETPEGTIVGNIDAPFCAP